VQRPPITAAARLAQQLRTEIVSGRRPHGSVLEPTKRLAYTYEASASTVARACKLLAEEGLLHALPRSVRVVDYEAPTAEVPSDEQVVLLIGGFPGSGKSELARIIARETHWTMLDKDTTTRAVVELALTTLDCSPHDRESETYRTIVRPREYEALLAALEENVELGNSCVVAAPFLTEVTDAAWCARIRAMIESRGASVHFAWVNCDPETMLHYLRKRGAGRDGAKLADWPAWLASIDLRLRPATEYEQIDNSATSAPLQVQAQALLAKITGQHCEVVKER
jgi:predicted kinase